MIILDPQGEDASKTFAKRHIKLIYQKLDAWTANNNRSGRDYKGRAYR